MNFTVYSKPNCPQCEMAKAYISNRGLKYKEITLDVGQHKFEHNEYITRDELLLKVPGAKTMPQIFKDGEHLGGYKELMGLLKTQ